MDLFQTILGSWMPIARGKSLGAAVADSAELRRVSILKSVSPLALWVWWACS